MVIHDLGAEATYIEHLRTSWFIWREVGSTGYPDVSVIRYVDDSSDHRHGTIVYQVGGGAWRIARNTGMTVKILSSFGVMARPIHYTRLSLP